MCADPSSPGRRRAAGRRSSSVGALALALVVLAGWAVVRAAAGGTSAVDQRALGPVILVPGYGGDTSDLDPLVAQLRR